LTVLEEPAQRTRGGAGAVDHIVDLHLRLAAFVDEFEGGGDEAVARRRVGSGISCTRWGRVISYIGDAAFVDQKFFIKYRDQEPVAAFDGFSMVRIDGEWKIASIISDMLWRARRDSNP